MDAALARHRLVVGLRDLPSSLIVVRKELRDTFLSLRAYLMATIAFIGISFFMWLQTEIPMGTSPIVEMIVALLSLLGLFFAVTFSMDAIVSEKALRTLPLVKASPISSSSIVAGKYITIVLTWMVILGISILYFVLGGKALVGHVGWDKLALGYASTILVVSAVGSLAIFVSSVSSSVKSSALGSLGILFGFMGISVARQLFAGFQSVMDVLNFLRNLSVIRYSGLVTEQLFQNGQDAWWGVAGLLAYTVIFLIGAICVLGLRESDLP